MSRDRPVLRAIKLLTLIERSAGGLRVTDMAEQLGAQPRAIYRDLDILQQLEVPLFTDREGRESYWKIDSDYRTRLSIPFSLSELLSLYLAQDSLRSLEGTVFYDSLRSLFEKLWPILPKPLFREMAGLRKDIRTFLVDRVQRIKLSEESFTLPPDFSLANYLRHSFGMFTEDLVRVKVHFHKSLTRILLERRWHPSQKNKKLKDGSLELTFEVAGAKEVKTWIMGFGSLAKVLEPVSLVKDIKEDLEKSLKSYTKL